MPPPTTRPAAPAPTVPCRKFLRLMPLRPPPPPPPAAALPAGAASPPGAVPPPSSGVASLMVPPRSWHSAPAHLPTEPRRTLLRLHPPATARRLGTGGCI